MPLDQQATTDSDLTKHPYKCASTQFLKLVEKSAIDHSYLSLLHSLNRGKYIVLEKDVVMSFHGHTSFNDEDDILTIWLRIQ